MENAPGPQARCPTRAHRGGCLCGAVRYVARSVPGAVVHCYCSMCRRQGGAAAQTFVRFPLDAVDFPSGRPRIYRSSRNVERGFCDCCGSSITFAYLNAPDQLWLTAGTLDVPDAIEPTANFCAGDRVGWIKIDPDLPGYR